MCFNCEGLSHEAHDCPCPVLCCICKEEGHLGINCTYSWFCSTVSPTDKQDDVAVESDDNDGLSDCSYGRGGDYLLPTFDPAGIDIDCITSIRWRASNRSWIISFNSALAKETALETASVEIGGTAVFLGNCENSLVLIKIYKAPNELPHTALIGRLSHYGRVLSFRRHKIAQFINNGVRTARMTLNRHIPNIINVGGEIIRIWYPNQPENCHNCGSPDHLV